MGERLCPCFVLPDIALGCTGAGRALLFQLVFENGSIHGVNKNVYDLHVFAGKKSSN